MKKYYYDLHIHSCLSPCGDNESTPDSIAGMGELNGLNIMALTDHNTVKNCPAFFKAALRHGILPIAGMELTTAEDIHAVCLFPNLDMAIAFEAELDKHRMKILNRADIFGEQLIMDDSDNVIGNEEYLLSMATDISLDNAPKLVEAFGGICYPAHIDRDSNGAISVLGAFPKTPIFPCAEVHFREKVDEMSLKSGLNPQKLVISSDAHFLWDIKDAQDYFLLDDGINPDNVGEYVIKFLKEQL